MRNRQWCKKYSEKATSPNKKNKTNVTPEKDVMTSAYQSFPEDTSSLHLWLVNKGERTSTSPLALGYALLGSSRHVRAYYCMPESSLGFLCSDPFRRDMFRPLCRLEMFCVIPHVLVR